MVGKYLSRVGVGGALLSQEGGIHLIIWIKITIYTHSISYYCILFYNVLQYWGADNCHYLQ